MTEHLMPAGTPAPRPAHRHLRRIFDAALIVVLAAFPTLAAIDPAPIAAANMSPRVAVILVEFSNTGIASPGTRSAVDYTMFSSSSSVAAYYRQVSYRRVNVTGKVYGPIRIAATSYGCHFNTRPWTVDHYSVQWWEHLAKAKLVAMGYNLSGYSKFVIAWPRVSSCSWGGTAPIGGTTTYINGESTNRYVMTHEFGHSLGMHHAGTIRCKTPSGTPTALSGSCTMSETYDPSDLMLTHYPLMADNKRQLSAFHRYQIGALLPSEQVTIAGSGSYDVSLNPVEYPAAVIKSIRVARPGLAAVPNAWTAPTPTTYPYIYIDWRQPYGWFDNFASTDPFVNGASLRLGDNLPQPPYSNPSRLIDTTPSTATYADAPLLVGRTMTDLVTGVTITVVSKTIDALDPSKSVMVIHITIP
jgi:hypothetical protein